MWQYKIGGQYWNDSHVQDSEALNRSIEMEPDIRVHISHQFSGWMPTVDRPTIRSTDAFDIIGDQMTNLENDDFYETVKMKDVRETIRSWLFLPMGGHGNPSRADSKDEKLQFNLSSGSFDAMEELFQQYTRST